MAKAPKHPANRQRQRSTLLAETLEPRLLFSADPLTLLLDWHDSASDSATSSHADTSTLQHDARPDIHRIDHSGTTHELVLINTDIADREVLQQAVLGLTASQPMAVYLLDSAQDGIEQLSRILEQHDEVDAIHVLGHGSAGAFALGGTMLDQHSASGRATELVELRDHFSENADLLLYGCAVAAEDRVLLDELSAILKVDVAASNDLTGNPATDRNPAPETDWDLEVTSGLIERNSLFVAKDDVAWSGVLANVTVTTTLDVFDIDTDVEDIADLISDPGDDGLISLREAIFAANADPDTDYIALPSGTYQLTNSGSGNDAGDLDIRESVTIAGAGSSQTIIDGNGIDRVFDINASTVVFEDFTITGGVAPNSDNGGAIDIDGTNLTVDRLIIDGNETDNGTGGGIYVKSNATLTIRDSVVSNNTAGKGNAPTYRDGGGIYSDGTVTVLRSEFDLNDARYAGAIYNGGGSLIIEDSSFATNTAALAGGAIYSENSGSLQVDRSTFASNLSSTDAGAVWFDGNTSFDYVTFSGNTASSEGGALVANGTGNRIDNSTFYGNTATIDAAAISSGGTLGIKGSVFWSNTTGGASTISGSINSLGFNSWQPASFDDAIDSDLRGQDPLLGALQNNGGFVNTRLPGSGSPLIDAGYENAGLDATLTNQNAIPDIGAAEARTNAIAEKLYWVDKADKAIYRANTDGSAMQYIRSTTHVPFDIEIDSTNDYLYWVENDIDSASPTHLGSVFRSDLDGGNRVELVTNILGPAGIALDIANGHMYVTSNGDGTNDSAPFENYILRFDLNGSNEVQLVTGYQSDPVPQRMISPWDIEYDPVNEFLYWTDSATSAEVKRLDIGGGGTPQQIFVPDESNNERAYGLAVYEGTTAFSLATGPTLEGYDYTPGVGVGKPYAAGTEGVVISKENAQVYATVLSGDIERVVSITGTNILSGLNQPGAIAMAYIDPVNNPPTLDANNPLGVNEAGSEPLSALELDASDSDSADADLVFNVTSSPNSGAVENAAGVEITSFTVADITAGEVIYVHDGSGGDSDEFLFTFSDGLYVSPSNTFSISVTTFEDPPVANDNAYTLDEGTLKNLTILANDTDEETGLNSSSLVITSAPSQGTAIQQVDGSVDYTHNGSETTSDSFQYTIEDMAGNVSNIATVTLTINPLNDPPVAIFNSDSVAEGDSVTIPVAGNDIDAEGSLNLASIAIVTAPLHGAASSDFSGSIIYTHNGSETTSDTLTYTIADTAGAISNQASVNISINTFDDNPIATDDADALPEGGSKNLDILSNDSDEETGLDPGAVVITTAASNGTTTVLADGSVDYTHNGGETLSDSFQYTVEDTTGNVSAVATVALTINAVNDPPVANTDASLVDEGDSITIPVSNNDTDAENALDLLSIAITSAPVNGSATPDGAGAIVYAHSGSETTSDTLTYTINDAAGVTSNSATVNLTINALNDTPVAVDDSDTLDEGGNSNIAVLTNDSDADDGLDTSSIAITSPPINGSATANPDGTIDYVHNGSETLTDSIAYTVDDVSGATSNQAVVAISINALNDLPVAVDDSMTLSEGASQTVTVLANDSDADDGLDTASVNILTFPSSGLAAFNPGGTITYAHSGAETTSDSLTYQVADVSGGMSNVATVSITIIPQNDNPVTNPDSTTVTEGGTVAIDHLANDSDADDGIAANQISIVTPPAYGTASLNPDNTLQYAHDGSEAATDFLEYTVVDNAGAVSNVSRIDISVSPVNDTPVALADSFSLAEGAMSSLDVLANDIDVDDGLDVSQVQVLAPPSRGSLSVQPDGTVDYTHDGSETISDSFTYFVRDFSGVASNVTTVNLTVTPVNDAPVATDDTVAVDEGNAGDFALLVNDTDAEASIAPAYTFVTAPLYGSLVIQPDNTVRYQHDGSETTSDSFQYTIEDTDGVTSNVADVTITINPVNDTPVTFTDNFTVAENSNTTLDVLSNDNDADDGLDVSSVTITTPPSNGTATTLASGEIAYLHDGSETSIDSFTYLVRDMAGQASITTTVSLTITPENDSPVANDDNSTVAEADSVSIVVLANDTDAENPSDPGMVSITTAPLQGTALVQTDNTVVYTHDGSETTSDSFGYRIQDAQGAISTDATVAVTVLPVNDAPNAQDDTASVIEGGFSDHSATSNDTDSEMGIDSTTLVFTTLPAHGTVTLLVSGDVRYLHDGTETTTDSYQYTVSDTDGAVSNVATVSVGITPVNDIPTSVDDAFTLNEGDSSNLNIIANDVDPDDGLDTGSVVITGSPVNGTVSVLPSGNVSYQHNGSETVADAFTYTVMDMAGQVSPQATVNLSINPVNDRPVVTDDTTTISEGDTISIAVLANDVDAEFGIDPASVLIDTGPLVGSGRVETDGRITYTHNGGESTADSLTYTVADIDGARSQPATLALTIAPVNDAPVAQHDSAALVEAGSVSVNVLNNDTDADSNMADATVQIVSTPTFGSISIAADQSLSYTHDGSENFNDTFRYQVIDSSGAASVPAIVNLAIAPVNDAPIAVNDNADLDEAASINIDILANDMDAETQVQATSVNLISSPLHGSAVVRADGSIDYVHDGSETVFDSIKYTVDDTEGKASNIATVSLTISPVNDIPQLQPDVFTLDEGTIAILDVLANDSDADDGLDVGSLIIASPPTNGVAQIQTDGTLLYQHDGSESLTDSLTYSVADAAGVSVGPEQVSLSIHPINDQPLASPDSATVIEGENVTIAVLSNDSDAEEALTGTHVELASDATHGSLNVTDNGEVVYQHNGSDSLTDEFLYRLVDSAGAASSAVAVNVTIQPVDDIPATANDEFELDEGGSTELAIFTNDTDSDSGILDNTLEMLSLPQHGSLTVLENGNVHYAHDGSETTLDSFTYRLLTPGGIASAEAVVTLNITPVNDTPQLTIDPTLTLTAPFAMNLPEALAVDNETDELAYAVTLVDGSPLPPSIEFDKDLLTLTVIDAQSNTIPEQVILTATDAGGAQASLTIFLLNEPELAAAHTDNIATDAVDVETSASPAVSLAATIDGGEDENSQQSANTDMEKLIDTAIQALESPPDETNRIAVVAPVSTIISSKSGPALTTEPEPENEFAESTPDDFETADESPAVVNLLPINAFSLEQLFASIELYDPQSDLRLKDQLNLLKDDTDHNALQATRVAIGTTATSAAASVGYVLWLARGGILLSSVMTALPAWRFVDPFPVLSRLNDDAEGEDAETLQSIVDDKTSSDVSRKADRAQTSGSS